CVRFSVLIQYTHPVSSDGPHRHRFARGAGGAMATRLRPTGGASEVLQAVVMPMTAKEIVKALEQIQESLDKASDAIYVAKTALREQECEVDRATVTVLDEMAFGGIEEAQT